MDDSASTWVMLRGLTRERRHWGDFPERFRESLGNAQVLLPDLPGAGTERLRSAPLAIEDYSADLRHRILSQLQAVQGKKYLFGISMGGMIALDLLARYPADFDGAVLLNSSTANMGGPWERFRPVAIPAVLRNMLDPSVLRRERSIVELVVNRGERRASIVQQWSEIQQTAPTSRLNMLRQMIAAARFRPNLERIQQPILLLASNQDRLVDFEISKRLHAKLSGSTLAIHPDAGHDLPIDAPEWICDQVRLWLSSL